jgi:triacylglycerol lipase
MRRSTLIAVALSTIFASAPVVHASTVTETPADPAFSIDPEAAAQAVDCIVPEEPVAADVDAVVLVHGTGTEGHEQYAWNYEVRLAEERIPYCVVTYPDRGQGDMQVSAEYVVVAVHEAAAISPSGRVDMVGHSQGATMPRWAVKYWPSVQAVLDDFVMHAGPNHGTLVADDPLAGNDLLGPLGGRPAVYHQFRTDSRFNHHLNLGDETPGEADYTSIYAYTDELVQPSGPNGPATAALEVDDPTRVVNVNVQDVCPGRLVDHLSIGTTDRFIMDLTIATLRHPGPADLSAVSTTACQLPDQYVTPQTLAGFGRTGDGFGGGEAGYALDPDNYSTGEPPIRDYAIAHDAATD